MFKLYHSCTKVFLKFKNTQRCIGCSQFKQTQLIKNLNSNIQLVGLSRVFIAAAAAAAKSLQSCPTLCDPIDGSPPGSSIPGILQARTLEWVAISFSNAFMHAKSLQSCPTLCDPIKQCTLLLKHYFICVQLFQNTFI